LDLVKSALYIRSSLSATLSYRMNYPEIERSRNRSKQKAINNKQLVFKKVRSQKSDGGNQKLEPETRIR
jgi:hypothetical protein